MSEKKKRLFICRDDLTLGELGCSAVVTREAINFYDVTIIVLLSDDKNNA